MCVPNKREALLLGPKSPIDHSHFEETDETLGGPNVIARMFHEERIKRVGNLPQWAFRSVETEAILLCLSKFDMSFQDERDA